MPTTGTDNRSEVFSRPSAEFHPDGTMEVRASAALNCRRSLWYSATGYVPTNPPGEESLMAMEAGNALEPVVMGAMKRAGWMVHPADARDPQPVTVKLGPTILVTGHPDGTVRMPLSQDGGGSKDSTAEVFLFDEDEVNQPAHGIEKVVEVKTRGPEAFKRWRTLGAERSHPASVAQAAVYSLGTFGEVRDAVIATMDTGNRTWDYEVIPAERLERALHNAGRWLSPLAEHHTLHGPDPDALPNRDFNAGSWQCRSCPFLDVCLPGGAMGDKTEEEPEIEEVTDEEAREAVRVYTEAKLSMKEPEKTKKTALATLKAWMRQKGDTKVSVGGRTVSLVQSRRYTVNYRRLNGLLDPETRAEIVTERESEYVRVT